MELTFAQILNVDEDGNGFFNSDFTRTDAIELFWKIMFARPDSNMVKILDLCCIDYRDKDHLLSICSEGTDHEMSNEEIEPLIKGRALKMAQFIASLGLRSVLSRQLNNDVYLVVKW